MSLSVEFFFDHAGALLNAPLFGVGGIVAVVLAMGLDAWLGEPKRYHPLVGFAHWATRWQRLLCPASSQARPWLGRVAGVLALLVALAPVFIVIALLLALESLSPWLSWLAGIVVLYSCLGWHSLKAHVLAVNSALLQQDLPLARQRLSWIVSRDTDRLDAQQIAQANTETLLENSADAVFASVFWFVLAGPVGALLHRWVNTLDAMWGYKTPQWRYWGWAAARADDVMNWLPARVLALLFLLAAWVRYGTQAVSRGWQGWREQAPQCVSPNGGVVMCVGACVLHVRLSDGAYYHGQWQAKPTMGCGDAATPQTLASAIQLIRAALLWVLAAWVLFAVISLAYVRLGGS